MAMRTSARTGDRQKVVAWLQALLRERLVAVVLFGSRARGDHRSESDWDLLVISRGLPENLWERSRVFVGPSQAVMEEGRLDLMAKTPEMFDDYLPAVYLDIALDAEVLYDPAGWAAERLAKLHLIMEKAGLYREQIPGVGFEWRWRVPPPFGQWAIEWDYLDHAG